MKRSVADDGDDAEGEESEVEGEESEVEDDEYDEEAAEAALLVVIETKEDAAGSPYHFEFTLRKHYEFDSVLQISATTKKGSATVGSLKGSMCVLRPAPQ